MDILVAKLLNSSDTRDVKYTDIILDLHRSKKSTRGKYITYIVYGIDRGILNIDKLFFKSVLGCSDVSHCFAAGIFLRMGAKINRFYNDKNISVHIIERFYNYNHEIFVFLMAMLLLKGFSYNDYTNRTSSTTVGDYFKSNGIQIFFPKNIRLDNQRLLNLYMDEILTKDEYSYQPYELVENLNINLIKKKLLSVNYKNCEDTLLQYITDSCNFNMFISAIEATYPVTYFTIERLCVQLRKAYDNNNNVLVDQLVEIFKYLQTKKIYIDEYQYDYIKDIESSLKYHSTMSINRKIKELLTVNMKDNELPMYTLTKLKFLPSYIYDLDDKQLENIKYKAIYYRMEKNGTENVMDRI
mgnify:CR=1 FL=1